MTLTAQQERFADEYLIDLNATAAYKRAGYKSIGNAAEAGASRLLSNAKVQQYVQQRMADRTKRTELSQDYVLKTIMDTVERCRQAEPVRDREGNETGEYKFDSTAVLRGAELLGKHLKMFTDKTELTGANGGPIDQSITVSFVRPQNGD
jgi:phage terminase small subunit